MRLPWAVERHSRTTGRWRNHERLPKLSIGPVGDPRPFGAGARSPVRRDESQKNDMPQMLHVAETDVGRGRRSPSASAASRADGRARQTGPAEAAIRRGPSDKPKLANAGVAGRTRTQENTITCRFSRLGIQISARPISLAVATCWLARAIKPAMVETVVSAALRVSELSHSRHVT